MVMVMNLMTIRWRYKCLQIRGQLLGEFTQPSKSKTRKNFYMRYMILGSAPDLLFNMHMTYSRLDILNINNHKILYIYLAGNQI